MTKHFAIGLQALTAEEKKRVKEFMSEKGTWWNWIPGFWLFVSDEDIDPEQVRDSLKARTRTTNSDVLVLAVEPVTWYGFGPTGGQKNMFTWLRRNWKKSQD